MIKQLRMFSLQNHTSSSLLLVQDVPRQHILSSLASCSETICTLVMQLDVHLLYPAVHRFFHIARIAKDMDRHGSIHFLRITQNLLMVSIWRKMQFAKNC